MAQRTVVHFYCDNCDKELDMEDAVTLTHFEVLAKHADASLGDNIFCSFKCLFAFLEKTLREREILDTLH